MTKDLEGPDEFPPEPGFIEVAAEMAEEHLNERPAPQGLAGRLTWVMDNLSGIVVFALTCIVTAGVVTRLMGVPFIGSVEVASLTLVAMTLLAAPGLAHRDEHVKVELTNGLGGPRTQRVIDVLALVVQIAVTLVLLYATAVLFISDLSHPVTVAGELRWPRYLISAILPLSMLLMLGILVPKLVKVVRAPLHTDVQKKEG